MAAARALLLPALCALALLPRSSAAAVDRAALLRLTDAELAARFGAPVQPTRNTTYQDKIEHFVVLFLDCLLYTSPSPRDRG